MIEDVFDLFPPPRDALDVGTGTGILGIAAACLGAKRVLAVDTDPVAVDIASKNAWENGVADVFRAETTPLSAISGAFDLVLGNLIAEILIDMAPELLRRTAPGGHLILSGILAEKSGWVVDEFVKNGASLLAESADGQWATLLFRREG
jgi:ribosomal protein L11 methyltransferase